ncbi:hypothetical protein CBL_01960 [Carabus blaptoides fortunei]
METVKANHLNLSISFPFVCVSVRCGNLQRRPQSEKDHPIGHTRFQPRNSLNLLLCGTLFGSELKENDTNIKNIIDHETILKDGCIASEKIVNELIKSLQAAIVDTCEQYRFFLLKQVEIYENGMYMNPLDEYWDTLVPYRIEADNLKKQFNSYENMTEYVRQIAYGLALCSAAIENMDFKDCASNEFLELKQILKQQAVENMKLETKLMQINMKSIILTKT